MKSVAIFLFGIILYGPVYAIGEQAPMLSVLIAGSIDKSSVHQPGLASLLHSAVDHEIRRGRLQTIS